MRDAVPTSARTPRADRPAPPDLASAGDDAGPAVVPGIRADLHLTARPARREHAVLTAPVSFPASAPVSAPGEEAAR